jgi:hypothetical protein
MLHDMSREFWHISGLVLLGLGVAGPIAGWFLGIDKFFLVMGPVCCFLGAGYFLQLGNYSKPRKEREGESGEIKPL